MGAMKAVREVRGEKEVRMGGKNGKRAPLNHFHSDPKSWLRASCMGFK